jgi:hypothetical protein
VGLVVHAAPAPRVRVDDEARVDGYRLIIATEWTLAGCALLAYTLSDLAPHEVFLVLLVVAALLLPAVVLHAALDLRALLIAPRTASPADS